MKRFLIATIIVAAVVGASFAYLPPELKAGLRYALPASPEPTPEAMPAPEKPQKQAPDKCVDGSALTVTGRDANQTSYKCESGAVGAYLN
jgi:hypothetical protein